MSHKDPAEPVKFVRGIPVEKLNTYLGPKQLEDLYDTYGAHRVNLAIRDYRKICGLEQP